MHLETTKVFNTLTKNSQISVNSENRKQDLTDKLFNLISNFGDCNTADDQQREIASVIRYISSWQKNPEMLEKSKFFLSSFIQIRNQLNNIDQPIEILSFAKTEFDYLLSKFECDNTCEKEQIIHDYLTSMVYFAMQTRTYTASQMQKVYLQNKHNLPYFEMQNPIIVNLSQQIASFVINLKFSTHQQIEHNRKFKSENNLDLWQTRFETTTNTDSKPIKDKDLDRLNIIEQNTTLTNYERQKLEITDLVDQPGYKSALQDFGIWATNTKINLNQEIQHQVKNLDFTQLGEYWYILEGGIRFNQDQQYQNIVKNLAIKTQTNLKEQMANFILTHLEYLSQFDFSLPQISDTQANQKIMEIIYEMFISMHQSYLDTAIRCDNLVDNINTNSAFQLSPIAKTMLEAKKQVLEEILNSWQKILINNFGTNFDQVLTFQK